MDLGLLFFLAKTPVTVVWSFFISFVYTLTLLLRLKRNLLDPRTWFTLFFVMFVFTAALTFFKFLLSLLSHLTLGKPLQNFTHLGGNWLINYGLSSAVLYLISFPLAEALTFRITSALKGTSFFKLEVLEIFRAYIRESLRKRIVRSVAIVGTGVLLGVVQAW